MLKIRLMRIGAKKRPFYRIVVVDGRAKRTGAYLELLGTYNPITNPHEIKLKQDRIDHWTKQGAQMSDGFLRIIGKAKQRPPRKAKKAKAEKPAEKVVEKVEDVKTDKIATVRGDVGPRDDETENQEDNIEPVISNPEKPDEKSQDLDSSPAKPVANDNEKPEEK